MIKFCKLCGNAFSPYEGDEGYCKSCSEEIEEKFIEIRNNNLKRLKGMMGP